MNAWKYVLDGQHCGPVETPALLALINNGTLNGDALVCREGVGDWAPASTIAEFAAPGATASPAAPTSASYAGTPSATASSPTDSAPAPDAADAEQNKVFAVLAYVGILFLVPLLAAPKSRFARYHTNQGIVLFVASMVLSFGFYILAFVPVLGRLMGFVGYLVWLAVFALMILGIVNAANGKCQPLPVIGGYKLLK